ncbi:MAG: hypothetical protein ACK55I_20915, partial [bacterium]
MLRTFGPGEHIQDDAIKEVIGYREERLFEGVLANRGQPEDDEHRAQQIEELRGVVVSLAPIVVPGPDRNECQGDVHRHVSGDADQARPPEGRDDRVVGLAHVRVDVRILGEGHERLAVTEAEQRCLPAGRDVHPDRVPPH